MAVELSAPFNWCDSRCERCPLSDDCALARRLRGQRWVHEMRGEDPDDPAIVMADIEADLERTAALVERIAEEEGVSLDEPLRVPTSLLAARLRRASMAYASAVHAIAQGRPEDAAGRALSASRLVAMKIARLCAFDPFDRVPDDDAWLADGVPNLILVERSAAEVESALAALEAPDEAAAQRYQKAAGEIQRLVAPWIATIDPEARAAMDALIAAGRAPSPFCRTEAPAPVTR